MEQKLYNLKRTDHLIHPTNLLAGYDVSKIKPVDGKFPTRVYGANSKKALVGKIFARLMEIIIDDLIDNGRQFLFPTRNVCILQVEEYPPYKKRRAFQKGNFAFIDRIQAENKLYRIVAKHSKGVHEVKIDRDKYKYLCKLVEQGKRYADYSIK